METTKPKGLPHRTGLFGGTFNPIHLGHRKVALDVLTRHRLDRIYFIPSAHPPHKTGGILAPAADRLQMVRLTLENDAGLWDSSLEIDRGGPSYSWETVLDFKSRLPENGRLFFLVGVDAFLDIHTWKNFRNLFENIAFIVMTRPPDTALSTDLARKLIVYIQNKISKDYALTPNEKSLCHPTKETIHLSTVPPMDIAATRLRQMMRLGQPIDRWVAPAVADYIHKKGLYQ